MKKLIAVVLIIPLIITCLYFGRNNIARTLISKLVRSSVGLDFSINKLTVKIMPSQLKAEGINVYNPQGFIDHMMATIPEIYVDYDLISSLKKEIHIKDARLNIKELSIIKTKEGLLNLTSLKPVPETKSEEIEKQTEIPKEESNAKREKEVISKKIHKPRKIKIDKLYIKIGKIIYKDYTEEPPKIKEYEVNIEEKFENITDLREFMNFFALKTIVSTAINNAIELNLGSIKVNLSGDAKEGDDISNENASNVTEQEKTVNYQTRETVKQTLDQLEKKLEFSLDKLDIANPKHSGNEKEKK